MGDPKHKEVGVWDSHDDLILVEYTPEGQSALRLVGLLLAAAPHLTALLDAADLYDPTSDDNDSGAGMHTVVTAISAAVSEQTGQVT